MEVEHLAENLTPTRYPPRTTPVRHELQPADDLM